MIDKEEIFKDLEKLKILSRIISHLMGDGCVSKKYFAYYNKNETLINNFKEDINSIFSEVHFITGKVNSGTPFVMVQNKPIFNFLTSIVKDYRGFALEVPDFLKTKELQIEFLKAIFDDEGCVGLRIFKKTNEIKRNVTLCAKSELFLSQIKGILEENFLIKCNKLTKCVKKKDNKEFDYYVLSITGKENFEKFRDKINFYHPEKKLKLDILINSYIRK